jgi:hypothetical protein
LLTAAFIFSSNPCLSSPLFFFLFSVSFLCSVCRSYGGGLGFSDKGGTAEEKQRRRRDMNGGGVHGAREDASWARLLGSGPLQIGLPVVH